MRQQRDGRPDLWLRAVVLVTVIGLGAGACQSQARPFTLQDAGTPAPEDAGGDAGPPDGGWPCVPDPLDAGVTDWARRCPAPSPSPRFATTMAYDAKLGVTVLFGGGNGNIQPLGDTWSWDGTTWTIFAPPNSPPGRDFSAMVYDSRQQVMVLCGGQEWNTYVLDDTWQWDGLNWQQMMPAHNPPGRFYNAMAYDQARGVTVLFGGEEWYSGDILGDTWEWDGNDWTQVAGPGLDAGADAAIPESPSPRILHGMVYDSARGVTVLFGGVSEPDGGVFRYDNDTWEWDGHAWTERSPQASPAGRDQISMVYDTLRNVTVLFGGFSQAGNPVTFGDTWEWDGTNWAQITPPISPSARDAAGVAFDATFGVAVLFGGCPEKSCGLAPRDLLSDTWLWQTGTPQ